MKYIIMCGGNYKEWETPRHLTKICGEEIVARTIRLLKENGIKDISISSNNPIFEKFNLPVLNHNNSYDIDTVKGDWVDAFYLTDEPTCYLFGDVVFSPEAIKTIVNTETDDMEFFGSKKPFASNYIKTHEEPFALKVVNTKHLKDAIQRTKELDRQGKFWRKAIMWELWTVIKDAPLQTKLDEYTTDYYAINDYTVDIDRKEDVIKLQQILFKEMLGGKMIKVEVIEEFTLGKFDELKNLVRNNEEKNEKGRLYVKDIFECDKEMADYLTGNNKYKTPYVKIIEIIPEENPVQATKSDVVDNSTSSDEMVAKKKNKKRKK